MKKLDLRGLACPEPVVVTRRALLEGERDLQVQVDDADSAGNVERMARSLGAEVRVREAGTEFVLDIVAGEAVAAAQEQGTTFLLASDSVGRGAEELGHTLMKMFLNALADAPQPPARLLLMNAGVKLASEGADSVSALKNLECLGTEILVCGTCLDYYHLREKMAVGTVSNMQEISEAMASASNTVTL